MIVEVNPHALKHSITPDEIRMVAHGYYLRYLLFDEERPDATVYRSIGRDENQPWIEILGEWYAEEDTMHVFHAMMLAQPVVTEAALATGRSWEVHPHDLARQRRYIGPQFTPETTPTQPTPKEES